jgi:hypothetical protein
MVTKKEKWDGRSRPTNALYKKRWNEVFNKEDIKEAEKIIDEEERKKNEEE